MFSVEGKVIVVTGGGTGIGRAIVSRLVTAGANVAFCTRSDSTALADELGALFVRVDVADEDGVRSFMDMVHDAFGPIDVLVNNAGSWDFDSPIETADAGKFRRDHEVNVIGTLNCMKHAAPRMVDGGIVINISSLAATVSMPGYGPYNTSKAGQAALTRTAAVELGARGIRVVDVAPGTVATEGLADETDSAAEVEAFSRITPLRRICEMDEVAATVHFLASDDCRYISGSAIVLDGGLGAGISLGLAGLLLGEDG